MVTGVVDYDQSDSFAEFYYPLEDGEVIGWNARQPKLPRWLRCLLEYDFHDKPICRSWLKLQWI